MDTHTSDSTIAVIIIDDNEDHLKLIERSVRVAFEGDARRVETHPYLNPGAGLAELPVHQQAVILLDYRLTGATGLDWLSDFTRADVGPVILVTGSGDESIAAEAFRRGASDYMAKSEGVQNPELVRKTINEALRRYKIVQTNQDLARRLKRSNSELGRKNERLAELTSTAHRFVDDVAHEFRTPLAVIKEFASIITDGIGGEVTPDQAKYLAYIVDASRDLTNLIDDFLDSGKMRAQTLRVDRREHTVTSLLDRTWPTIECRASAKGVTLERCEEPDLPAVFVDADKYRRTVVNLAINAIKFSDSGSRVVITARADGADGVLTEVTDFGPGLPPEALNDLFNRFTQGASAKQTDSKGFGLGLSIVKDLARINLGRVTVQSVLGEGSTFAFTTPRADPVCALDASLGLTRERSPYATITCLRVSSNDRSLVGADLYARVSGECHATDVLWMDADGDSVLAIGETGESDAWLNRLRDCPGAPDSLSIRMLGQWPVDEARAAILELLLSTSERLAHAQVDSHY